MLLMALKVKFLNCRKDEPFLSLGVFSRQGDLASISFSY